MDVLKRVKSELEQELKMPTEPPEETLRRLQEADAAETEVIYRRIQLQAKVQERIVKEIEDKIDLIVVLNQPRTRLKASELWDKYIRQ